jgi:hypothetical protein
VKVGRLLLVAGALTFGCARPKAEALAPADIAWQRTLDSAQRLAAAAQYASADSLLALFARDEPGSAGSREAIFWHGVFLLEPANTSARLRDAVAAFDGYLAQSGQLSHRAEARVLKRATLVMDSLSQSRSMDSVPAMHLVVTDDSSKTTAREQEMAKTVKALQDSLNKTTAELERIKKRLSTTPPGKP